MLKIMFNSSNFTKSWPAAIDWHTIITLSGLMLLTKGVELSGYLNQPELKGEEW